MTSTAVSVSVPVAPSTAFTVFTEELDLWWVRGPINYFDSARAVGMRCEPGVGGPASVGRAIGCVVNSGPTVVAGSGAVTGVR